MHKPIIGMNQLDHRDKPAAFECNVLAAVIFM